MKTFNHKGTQGKSDKQDSQRTFVPFVVKGFSNTERKSTEVHYP